MTGEIHGFVEPGFEPVARAFAEAFGADPRIGAALAVRRGGRPVVDLWGGVADARTDRPWSEDTLAVIFSCTKGVVSILAARLVQEGRLDYDALVTDYWPEFAAAGKAGSRVRDLLAHRAGLSAPRVDLTLDDVLDWDRVVGVLAAQEPLWEPGQGHAYHSVTHGWLIGEVIRRVTGMSVGAYLRELVTGPLRAEAWVGLPPELEHRVAHDLVAPSMAQLIADEAAAREPGTVDWRYRSMTLGGAFPRELVGEDAGFNLPAVHQAAVPGAGGIATARALAAIWSATIVETDGVSRLLDDATIARATEVQSEGEPVVRVPGPWPLWGMGFWLDGEVRRYLTPSSFGHEGAGGQVSFADPETGVGFAFLTNWMEAGADERATRIIDALRDVVR